MSIQMNTKVILVICSALMYLIKISTYILPAMGTDLGTMC